eukprot:549933-Pyramimonas_sp.AAC.1
MAQAESPVTAQIIVFLPYCPSPPFLRSLRPHCPPAIGTLSFQGLHQPRVAGNGYTPPKRVRSNKKKAGIHGLGYAH